MKAAFTLSQTVGPSSPVLSTLTAGAEPPLGQSGGRLWHRTPGGTREPHLPHPLLSQGWCTWQESRMCPLQVRPRAPALGEEGAALSCPISTGTTPSSPKAGARGRCKAEPPVHSASMSEGRGWASARRQWRQACPAPCPQTWTESKPAPRPPLWEGKQHCAGQLQL